MVRLASPSARAPPPAVAPTAAASGGGGRKHRVPWVVLAVVMPTLAALNLVAFLCLRKRRRPMPHVKQQNPMYSTEAEDIEMVDSMMIDASTLRTATGDFDESNKLGEGGFGAVYKASNILLDENMNPKISDFGLARIFGRDQTQAVTSRVVGTYGYMAPEYMMRGNYSVKSDAFSFGVMVLEIVTGRRNNSDGYRPLKSDEEDLLSTVWEHWEAGTVAELVDPSIGGSFPVGDVIRCVHIGLLCVQGDPAARPVMSSVVMMLGSDTRSPSTPRPNQGSSPGTTAPTKLCHCQQCR